MCDITMALYMCHISNDTYNTWSTSYNAYRLNTNSLNSSISNSQSSHQSSQ